ncbi:hypothetical protein XELAEV_18023726mg [Xenopus laevis]|uniref:Uncharacterized protein n=1 Tax=Xenopus laevis TaxID=8355 RepID=A0A974D4X5_XENLA|nr:hypothetical protein XELAEV_18023726mg [Xenopus laevis]
MTLGSEETKNRSGSKRKVTFSPQGRSPSRMCRREEGISVGGAGRSSRQEDVEGRGGNRDRDPYGSDEGEWGMEAESTPTRSEYRHTGPFPQGGGGECSRHWGTGGYRLPQTPSQRSQPQLYRDYDYDHWEEEDSCYAVDEYDYEDDVEFFPASRQGHNQRRPVRSLHWEDTGHYTNRVPSFYLRNRDEEESWLQWRREREQRQEREAGSSRGQGKKERPSSSTVGQSERNGDAVLGPSAKVSTLEATMGKSNLQKDVYSDVDSNSDGSDSEAEGGKIIALIKKYFKKYFKGKVQEKGVEKTKESTQSMVPIGAVDTYACAFTATVDHLPRKVRKDIEAGKFVDIYDLTREAVQANEDGVKQEEKGKRSKTIFEWLKGFLVFASVYLERKPEQCLNIIKYIDTIFDTYLFYKASSWSDYDMI